MYPGITWKRYKDGTMSEKNTALSLEKNIEAISKNNSVLKKKHVVMLLHSLNVLWPYTEKNIFEIFLKQCLGKAII